MARAIHARVKVALERRNKREKHMEVEAVNKLKRIKESLAGEKAREEERKEREKERKEREMLDKIKKIVAFILERDDLFKVKDVNKVLKTYTDLAFYHKVASLLAGRIGSIDAHDVLGEVAKTFGDGTFQDEVREAAREIYENKGK